MSPQSALSTIAEEEQRLYIALGEFTWAAIATVGNQQAVGVRAYDDLAPRAVARELRTRVLQETWARVAEDLEDYGFNDFRIAVLALLPVDEANP